MTTTIQIALALLLAGAGYGLLRRPGLRVERRGLRVPGASTGLLPWEAIEGVWQPSGSDAETLHVRLRDDTLPDRLRPRVVRVDLRDTELTAVELVQEILSRAAARAPLPLRAPGSASRLSS